MTVFDVNVRWLRVSRRARYSLGSAWERGIRAESLSEACRIAVARHTDKIFPSASCAGPVHPQPKETTQ